MRMGNLIVLTMKRWLCALFMMSCTLLQEHSSPKEYCNIQVGSKTGLLNRSRDSEQRETDEFEEAERRMLAEEAKVSLDVFLYVCVYRMAC